MPYSLPVLTDTTAFALVKYLREVLSDHPGYRRIYALDADTLLFNPRAEDGVSGVIERTHDTTFAVTGLWNPEEKRTVTVALGGDGDGGAGIDGTALCEAVAQALTLEFMDTDTGVEDRRREEMVRTWQAENPWYPAEDEVPRPYEIVEQFIDEDGDTAAVFWSADDEPEVRKLKEVMWLTFHGPIPAGHTVGHIDGNPNNNALTNLRLEQI